MTQFCLHSLAFLITAASCFAQALAPFEPPRGCYIGAYVELDPVARDDIQTFERLTGKKHATYFRYVGYGRPFPFEWANKLKQLGATPHIAWEPNEGLGSVQDDEYLRGWVQACAHYGRPIFLRFASEMNGDWEAWAGDPDNYIRKWRLVYEAFYRGAPNVALIWCPFATPKSTIPLYYPGDAYVDWVGVNVYSVVHHSGDVRKRAVDNAVQHLEFIYNLYADRKPIAVCEYAATHYCEASQNGTIDFAIREMKRMYETIETRFPRVRMINWFSVDAVDEGLAHNDYAVTSNERVLNAYRNLIASSHFLSGVGSGEAGPTVALPGTAAFPIASVGGTPAGPPTAWNGNGNQGSLRPSVPTIGSTPAPPATGGTPIAGARFATPPPNGIAIVVKGGDPGALRGNVNVEAIVGSGLRPARVVFELDGRFRAASTTPAYFFPWNADRSKPGQHRIHVTARNAGGAMIAEAEAVVIVAAPQ